MNRRNGCDEEWESVVVVGGRFLGDGANDVSLWPLVRRLNAMPILIDATVTHNLAKIRLHHRDAEWYCGCCYPPGRRLQCVIESAPRTPVC